MYEDRFGTPSRLVEKLQRHFGAFDLDAAAEPWSAVVDRYVTAQQDVFKVKPKAKHVYGNWPYGPGQLARFVAFARESVLQGRWQRVTQLVPHYTSEGWWQNVSKPEGKVVKSEWRYGWIDDPQLMNWQRFVSERLVTDIIPIKGRLGFRFPPRYVGARTIARFSSVVVRFSSSPNA